MQRTVDHTLRVPSSRTPVALAVTATALAVPGTLFAQQADGAAQAEAAGERAREIVDTALEKRLERREGVDDYTVYGRFQGAESIRYYEKITVDGRPAFRLVPPPEYEGEELEKAGLSGGLPTGGAAPGAASGARPGEAPGQAGDAPGAAGAALPGAAGDALPGGGDLPGMDDLPVPEGLQGAADRVGEAADRVGEARDAVTDNPLGRAAGGAVSGDLQRELARQGMESLVSGLQDDGSGQAMADARTEAMMFEAMRREARFVGTEQVDGRETFVLVADDLTGVDLAAHSDEETDIRLRSAKIWLDAEEYVALKSEMEIASGGGGPPMTIEVRSANYRRVESLYEPFRRTIRSRGVTQGLASDNPELQEKMQEAAEQFEQLEERLEDMPPAQRRMIEQRLGAQQEQIRAMAGGEGMSGTTIEMTTEDIVVNQGPPSRLGRGTITVSGGTDVEIPRTIASAGTGAHPGGDGTLSMVQLMGGLEGELTAILQLNVPGDLPVTGTATGQGGLVLQWADERAASLRSAENGATITVTAQTSRHVRGEFTMEAEGHLVEDRGAEPRALTVTVEGTFEAVLPRSGAQNPAGIGAREAPLTPGAAGGMQP